MKHPTDQNVQEVRLHAIELFDENIHNAEVARRVGVARSAVVRWRKTWEEQGPAGLEMTKRGPKPKLTDDQWQEITKLLLLGPNECGYDTQLWTLPRIADLIHRTTGVAYHPGYVWDILHRLGWSCQKPRTLAKERNEEAIQRWINEDWPRIKKGHKIAMPG